MGIAVFKETTTGGGYNIGIGYNPFTENITGTNNIGYWSGGTVWGVTIHLSGSDKTDNGRDIQ
jgi:hypothetical protein